MGKRASGEIGRETEPLGSNPSSATMSLSDIRQVMYPLHLLVYQMGIVIVPTCGAVVQSKLYMRALRMCLALSK